MTISRKDAIAMLARGFTRDQVVNYINELFGTRREIKVEHLLQHGCESFTLGEFDVTSNTGAEARPDDSEATTATSIDTV